jgi:uncharacterized membrane protein YgaE (UPF0421/DUF939 family)
VTFTVGFAVTLGVTLEVTFGVAFALALDVAFLVGVGEGFLVAALALPPKSEKATRATSNFLISIPPKCLDG